MNSSFKKFAKGFTIYTLIIGLISVALHWWIPQLPISPAFLYILILMYALTMLLIALLIKSMQNKLSRFVNAFMLLNFAKLFLYIIIIFVFAWLNRNAAVAFIITFFAYYILFSAYEIIILLKLNK
jgi:hypothetical protein